MRNTKLDANISENTIRHTPLHTQYYTRTIRRTEFDKKVNHT